MSVANFTTALTQILIGYVAQKGISKIIFRLAHDFFDLSGLLIFSAVMLYDGHESINIGKFRSEDFF